MGDRVLMQCFSGARVGPVVYCHWSGHDTPAIVRRFAKRMSNRDGDVSYATARLLQAAIGDDAGSTGFGVWNEVSLLTRGDTHGDAGVVLIDVSAAPFKFDCFGGYLKVGADGFPVISRDDE